MSQILYYSNYCEHCQNLLKQIAQHEIKDDIHFLCIDKRIKKDGAIYIQLENGQEILLPPNVKKVPSLLLLNKGNVVVDGENVNNYIFKNTQQQGSNNMNNLVNDEPLAFSLDDFGTIMSDSYSYLDQSSDEMAAKGDGGLRQMHNYFAISQSDNIETPPDNYTPDKIGANNMSLDQIQAQREQDIPRRQYMVSQ